MVLFANVVTGDTMKKTIGSIVENETKRVKIARIHQGWWRAFVLGMPEGKRPNNNTLTICNTVNVGEKYEGNFLSHTIAQVVNDVVLKRPANAPGIIDEKRLRSNLLSSQPLCFNFFGILNQDKKLAKTILSKFYPDISEVLNVFFEYAPTPKEEFTNDNSAFDVAIEVISNGQRGLIGIECKYTETFSQTEYNTNRYREIFNKSKSFNSSYKHLIKARFNQLFRNQLIGESLLQQEEFSFVHTALFCAPEDTSAQKIGAEFKELLNDKHSDFQIITFFDFIESFQQNQLTQSQREYSMLLWARYMGYQLSSKAKNEFLAE